jgi:predicted PurR-regulated permease PerM
MLGFIIALPLAMTVVEMIKYLRNSTRDGKIS